MYLAVNFGVVKLHHLAICLGVVKSLEDIGFLITRGGVSEMSSQSSRISLSTVTRFTEAALEIGSLLWSNQIYIREVKVGYDY